MYIKIFKGLAKFLFFGAIVITTLNLSYYAGLNDGSPFITIDLPVKDGKVEFYFSDVDATADCVKNLKVTMQSVDIEKVCALISTQGFRRLHFSRPTPTTPSPKTLTNV